jgi:hypothetical protein
MELPTDAFTFHAGGSSPSRLRLVPTGTSQGLLRFAAGVPPGPKSPPSCWVRTASPGCSRRRW